MPSSRGEYRAHRTNGYSENDEVCSGHGLHQAGRRAVEDAGGKSLADGLRANVETDDVTGFTCRA